MAPLPQTSLTDPERRLAALRQFAADGGYQLTVTGRSMDPALAQGQNVQVKDASRFWPGDILLFADHHDQLVVHRLLGYRYRHGHWQYIMRGDALAKHDVPVGRGRIVGKVVDVPVSLADRFRATARLLYLAVRYLPGKRR